jgi:hypothetical protein
VLVVHGSDFKTFSDVNPMLRLLAADPNLREFVFFNGTRTIQAIDDVFIKLFAGPCRSVE